MNDKIRITLEAARVNAKMTQAQAAKELGVSVTSIVKWENGTSVPGVDKALALARLYSMPVDNIIFCPEG